MAGILNNRLVSPTMYMWGANSDAYSINKSTKHGVAVGLFGLLYILRAIDVGKGYFRYFGSRWDLELRTTILLIISRALATEKSKHGSRCSDH